MMQRCMRGGWGNVIKGLILEHDAHFDPSVGLSTYLFLRSVDSFCSICLKSLWIFLL